MFDVMAMNKMVYLEVKLKEMGGGNGGTGRGEGGLDTISSDNDLAVDITVLVT